MIHEKGFEFWLEELSLDIRFISMKFKNGEVSKDDQVEIVKRLESVIDELNQVKSEVESSEITKEEE